jgi:structural maintenance of chromosomes protein 5
MPRSTRRIASEDSTKENTPSVPNTPVKTRTRGVNATPVRVKAEKLKGHAEERENDVNGTQDEEDGEEDEEEPIQNGDADEGSPKGRKRARANTAGEATSPRRTQDDDQSGETRTRAGVKTLPRDPADGCVPLFSSFCAMANEVWAVTFLARSSE